MGSQAGQGRKHHGKAEDGSAHARKGSGIRTLMRLAAIGLAAAAVTKELRTPAPDRTWNGVVAGFVPYDFRFPTVARFRERMWNPASHSLVSPRVFGVGWTLNAGKVVALVREKVAAAS